MKDPLLRASQADQILKNQTFEEAFSIVRQVYIDRMIATGEDDHLQRERFHRCIGALDDVKAALTAFINSGKLHVVNEERKQKLSERKEK